MWEETNHNRDLLHTLNTRNSIELYATEATNNTVTIPFSEMYPSNISHHRMNVVIYKMASSVIVVINCRTKSIHKHNIYRLISSYNLSI